MPEGLVLVSAASPYADGCNGAQQAGTNYKNAEVEPFLAADPTSKDHFIGVWQQDRWSNGGANGLATGVTFDGGKTWTRTAVHFTRCSGGTAANGGDYERASDPWVTIAPDGTAYQVALGFNNSTALKAILASRSTDGGRTWSDPIALQTDSSVDFVEDKESITADPKDAHYVYTVWDRLTGQSVVNSPTATGPTWFARTTNGGMSWEAARPIFDPGMDAQTIGNQIGVLPDGTLLDLFAYVTNASSNNPPTSVALLRSTDKGATWSSPIIVSETNFIGTLDSKNNAPIRTGGVLPGLAIDGTTGAAYAVWQDARPSAGARDGVVFSKSIDGGLHWSTPTQVNQAPKVQAFVPTVATLADGTIGVSYYDFRRDNPADPTSLLASLWLATSRDGGATWVESALSGTFDLRHAPIAGGLFLGDYQGLSRNGAAFLPFFVATTGDGNNRTEVYARPASVLPAASAIEQTSFERAPERKAFYRFGTRF